MAGDLERGHRFGKAVLHFVVYRAESTRAQSEALLEARLRELGFRIERVRLPLPEEPDWPYWLHFHPPDGDTVFFVYDLRKAFPEMLQYLNYRREIFVEQRVRAVFWVLEEEARKLALKAPDFWAFRTQVLEFLEVPPPRERAEIARELAWWGITEGLTREELDAYIALREKLLNELDESEESLATRTELLLTLGMLYYGQGEYQRALDSILFVMEAARRMDDDRLAVGAHTGLGAIYSDYTIGRYNDAILEFKKAIELAPDLALSHGGLGDAYAHLGRYDDAIAEYQKTIELDPKGAVPHNGLGTVYWRLGRYDDAIAEYERAIELDPKYAYPHNGLGSVYYELGRYDDAIAEYERAIELDPTNGGFYYNLGNVYLEPDRHEEAIQTYLKAIELKPDYLPAHLALGRIYRELNRYEELAKHSQQTRELLASDDHYNWACLEAICGNTEKALEHLKLALEKEPEFKEWAKRDPDLEWIRGDERFWEVVG